MISAYFRNNAADYKKMCAFHLLVARGIRSYISTILFAAVAVAFLVPGILLKSAEFCIGAAVLAALAAAWPFIFVAFQNSRVTKRLRANPEYEKTEQFFSFDESGLSLKLRRAGREEAHDIPYDKIARIYERRDRFYIYIGVSQALIVKKADIEEGKTDELAFLFRTTGKRFREKKKLRRKSEKES